MMSRVSYSSQIAALSAAIAIGGAAAVWYFGFASSSHSTAVVKPSLRLLNNAPSRLPADVLSRVTTLNPVYANPDRAHVAFSRGGVRIFAVTGDSGRMCMIVAKPDLMASTCGTTDVFGQIPMFLQFPNPDGTSAIAGLAADGFSSASVGTASAPIDNNAFWISNAPASSTLAVSGVAGSQKVRIAP